MVSALAYDEPNLNLLVGLGTETCRVCGYCVISGMARLHRNRGSKHRARADVNC